MKNNLILISFFLLSIVSFAQPMPDSLFIAQNKIRSIRVSWLEKGSRDTMSRYCLYQPLSFEEILTLVSDTNGFRKDTSVYDASGLLQYFERLELKGKKRKTDSTRTFIHYNYSGRKILSFSFYELKKKHGKAWDTISNRQTTYYYSPDWKKIDSCIILHNGSSASRQYYFYDEKNKISRIEYFSGASWKQVFKNSADSLHKLFCMQNFDHDSLVYSYFTIKHLKEIPPGEAEHPCAYTFPAEGLKGLVKINHVNAFGLLQSTEERNYRRDGSFEILSSEKYRFEGVTERNWKTAKLTSVKKGKTEETIYHYRFEYYQ